MRYLREIIKAKWNTKSLPRVIELLKEHRRWKQYQKNIDVFQNAVPWITIWATDFLENYLHKEMHVFEYGGGGSTIFFASRVKELVTIEHNKQWFEDLKKEMRKYTKVQWRDNFIEPEDALTTGLNRSHPDHYFSDDENFRNKIFSKYASSIDQFHDEYFDVVLIDGRVRPSCLKHSLAKVKQNGLLILDNADRSYYLEQFKNKLVNYELLSDHYGPTPYVASFTQTNIWKRIK